MSTVIKWSRGIALAALVSFAVPASAQTTVRYVHTDALGSVVATTDENRAVIERREYEPYGQQIVPLASDGPGYTGHVLDAATELTYMQQRYFDSASGVFLSVDPVTAREQPILGFNRYRYAAGSPYRFTDPDGRWVEDLVIGVPSLILGVKSLSDNISEGNVGSAILDGVGIVVDVVAIATPGVPGGAGLGIKAGRGLEAARDGRRVLHGPSPKINAGQQGKHQPGHNNFAPGRSVLNADPSELGRHAGTGQQVGKVEVGLPGSKERVDFGETIGTNIDKDGNAAETTVGIIHYGKNGIHIVPARPTQ